MSNFKTRMIVEVIYDINTKLNNNLHFIYICIYLRRSKKIWTKVQLHKKEIITMYSISLSRTLNPIDLFMKTL